MKYIIYHGNCYDGFTSAWVFEKARIANGELAKNFKFISCNYGEAFPIENPNKEEDECYILDFSFKRNIILEQKDKFKKFMILDHHVTAQEDLKDLDCCIFDMNVSGAKLTFRYLTDFYLDHEKRDILKRSEELVRLVEAVSDRDLFTFKLLGTSEYYYFMSSFDMTFENWDKICLTPFQEVLEKGTLIQHYERVYIRKTISEKFYITLRDVNDNAYIMPCVNVTKEFGTNACKAILNENPEINYACYFWINKNGKFVFGIRSRDGYDCSIIAKNYGGGGHKQASGWIGGQIEF